MLSRRGGSAAGLAGARLASGGRARRRGEARARRRGLAVAAARARARQRGRVIGREEVAALVRSKKRNTALKK